MAVRILLLVGALAVVSACGQSTSPTGPTPAQVQAAAAAQPSSATSTNVAIGGANEAAGAAESFDPNAVNIRAGDSVVFTNDDAVAHSVTADDGSWSSGNIDAEASFGRVFPNAGTFGYHDTAHPEIRGTIVVQ